MKLFLSSVTTGYAMATPNLVPGTLNVTIPDEYIVPADALILPEEYPYNRQSNLGETIKLKRCLIAGHKGLIVRPDSHEQGVGQFHGKSYLELMAQIHFRDTLGLTDGAIIEVQVEGPHPWLRSAK